MAAVRQVTTINPSWDKGASSNSYADNKLE